MNDSGQQPSKEQPKKVAPTISMLAKELQAQWYQERNMHLGNSVIRPHSHHKVWWSCDQCPDSLPHIWAATVDNRSSGTGCPFCSGASTCQHNTLARQAPQVARFWDAKKNHPLLPDHVTVSSRMRVHWKCSICTYEWQASVMDKTRRKTGCPKCAKANSGRKADGSRQKHPTFAQAKHALLEQWDHDKNRESGDSPDNTTLKSNKLIWWRCHKCPAGKEHSWQAQPKSRNSDKMATGCPFCERSVIATLWKLYVLILLLILTLNRMVSVLLKSQVRQRSSTIGCQMSLEPKSDLCICAQPMQNRKSSQLGADDLQHSIKGFVGSIFVLCCSCKQPIATCSKCASGDAVAELGTPFIYMQTALFAVGKCRSLYPLFQPCSNILYLEARLHIM